MSADARFADADPVPLALMAEDEQDLRILSALLQDAILPASEMSYDPRGRTLALLLNRFRWEDADQAAAEGRFVHVYVDAASPVAGAPREVRPVPDVVRSAVEALVRPR